MHEVASGSVLEVGIDMIVSSLRPAFVYTMV